MFQSIYKKFENMLRKFFDCIMILSCFVALISTNFDFCGVESFGYAHAVMLLIKILIKDSNMLQLFINTAIQRTFNLISNNNDPRGTRRCAPFCRNAL